MKRHILRSAIIASLIGVIAAIPLVLLLATDSSFLQTSPRILIFLVVSACPPWWAFWVLMGSPDDLSLLLVSCAAVLTLNAVLYSPLGVLHALTLQFRPAARRALVGVTYICLLVLGHVFFMQEPAWVYGLIQGLAA